MEDCKHFVHQLNVPCHSWQPIEAAWVAVTLEELASGEPLQILEKCMALAGSEAGWPVQKNKVLFQRKLIQELPDVALQLPYLVHERKLSSSVSVATAIELLPVRMTQLGERVAPEGYQVQRTPAALKQEEGGSNASQHLQIEVVHMTSLPDVLQQVVRIPMQVDDSSSVVVKT